MVFPKSMYCLNLEFRSILTCYLVPWSIVKSKKRNLSSHPLPSAALIATMQSNIFVMVVLLKSIRKFPGMFWNVSRSSVFSNMVGEHDVVCAEVLLSSHPYCVFSSSLRYHNLQLSASVDNGMPCVVSGLVCAAFPALKIVKGYDLAWS